MRTPDALVALAQAAQDRMVSSMDGSPRDRLVRRSSRAASLRCAAVLVESRRDLWEAAAASIALQHVAA